MNTLLVESARLHSQDMIAQNYFAHDTPQGADPGDRIAATGFNANGWAESIETNTQPSAYGGGFAANFAAWDAGYSLSNLIVDQGVPDLGHRVMLLDIGGLDQTMRQVGIGIASQDTPGRPLHLSTVRHHHRPGRDDRHRALPDRRRLQRRDRQRRVPAGRGPRRRDDHRQRRRLDDHDGRRRLRDPDRAGDVHGHRQRRRAAVADRAHGRRRQSERPARLRRGSQRRRSTPRPSAPADGLLGTFTAIAPGDTPASYSARSTGATATRRSPC